MSLWLNADELYELTGYRQIGRQREALVQLGIRFRSRPADGFPLVERAQFSGTMGRKQQPNFAAAGG